MPAYIAETTAVGTGIWDLNEPSQLGEKCVVIDARTLSDSNYRLADYGCGSTGVYPLCEFPMGEKIFFLRAKMKLFLGFR